MKRLSIILLLCVCVGLIGTARAKAAKVYVLAIADTTDGQIGQAVEANLGMIRTLFRHTVSPEMLAYRELKGERLTSDNLFAAIEKCPVTSEDSLVVWYSGKGCDREGEKYLELSNVTVIRSELAKAVQSTRARTQVLVTDRCQRFLESSVPRRAGEVPLPRTIAPGFDRLLLRGDGFFDLDSSVSESAGTFLSECGGLLTFALAYPASDFLQAGETGRKRKNSVKIKSSGSSVGKLSPKTGLLWDVAQDDQSDWATVLDQSRAVLARYSQDATKKLGDNLADNENEPTRPESDDDTSEGEDLPELVSVNINDILIAVDGKKLSSPDDLSRAAKTTGEVPLVFAENFSGLVYECRLDMAQQNLAAISVEAIPGLGLRVTTIEDPDTLFDLKLVAARPLVDKNIPFGLGGKFVKIPGQSMSSPETPYGMLLESVRANSAAARAGLEEGDVLLIIGAVRFSTSQGYRYALKTSPLLTDLVYIDADSREMTRGRTVYPHKVVEPADNLPEGCMRMSITLTSDVEGDE